MPPSAMTGVSLCLRRLDRVGDRGKLGHADTGDDAGRADRARPDADLDGVGTGVDQSLGAFGSRDVAGDHLHGIGQTLDSGNGIEHALRMAVGGVDDDKIDPCFDQRFTAHITGVANARRGGDTQPALLVLAGIGIRHRLLDILDRDEADAAVVGVDNEKLFDAVLVQQPLGFVLVDTLAHGDESVLGHQLRDFLAAVGGKADVAIGENADQLAGAAVAGALDHRDAGDAILLHQLQRIVERRVGVNGDRDSPPCPIRIS